MTIQKSLLQFQGARFTLEVSTVDKKKTEAQLNTF